MNRILPLALAVAGANAAVAEQLPLEHVLVSVPLHKQTAETALPVTVLSGDDLSRAAAATIGDTLNNTPGLANASFGPGVGQPVIRGQQGPRVTVLQNGTSSADASNISADHAVSVEAMLADSIEILRGPSTLLYGGGAIGGVVNVIDNRIPTRRIDGVEGGAEYRHDAASDMDTLVGRLEGGSGNFAFHIDGLYRDWNNLEIPGKAAREHGDEHHDEDHDHEEEHGEGHHEEHEGEETTDGYIANTDGRTRSATVGASYHFDKGFVGFAVNRLENEYGIPAGGHVHHDEDGHEGHEEGDHHEEDHDHEGEDHDHEEHGHEDGGVRIDLEQTRYDLAMHLHEPIPGFEVARAFVTYTDYQHKEIEPGGEVGTRYASDTWEGRLELVHEPFAGMHGVVGLQARDKEFSAVGEEAFIPLTDSRDFGLFLLEDYHINAWTFEGGLRYDRDERDPDTTFADSQDFNAFSASASALWDITDAWQLSLALSRAERAPSIEELYSNVENSDPESWIVHAATSAIELGNPDLDTETSNNADLSLRWDSGSHYVEVTAYYNDFHDYIDLENTGIEVDETPVHAYIQGDATFRGVEVDSQFTLASFGGGAVMLRLFGDITEGELDNGDDVPRLPPVRVGSHLSWGNDNLNVWGRVIDAAEQDKPGANEESTEGYTRWDAGVEYRLGVADSQLTLFATLNNITDEEIRLSTSFLRDVSPEAGRSLEAGLRYNF
ncbi:TonB-dependent receptor [Parahaliea aestuarii]|uniref:TonB-dependent receptor n=1 Tax=Parahaliea aestuarii TaxID=1852021 RepID=A0A5C8ZVT0_9GAMM|nr:TonB-dependent receptor [Parahaliea aestuarii]TXS92633.1 TonB-dependent receptor [Parahaliea aestuarii]